MRELADFIPHARLSLLSETSHTDVVARSAAILPAFLEEPLPR
jgi:hypothetical protein